MMISMSKVVKDGNPILRRKAGEVIFPLSEDVVKTSNDLMEYLEISQDSEQNKKYNLRPGVGIAAPQLGVSKRFSAILIRNADLPNDISDTNEGDYFKGVIYNPVITRESAKRCALGDGEGCLSVPDDVPGYVERSYRVSVEYQNELGENKLLKLVGYPAIVFQHEIDHLNGIMYYDHINKYNPWSDDQNVKYI